MPQQFNPNDWEILDNNQDFGGDDEWEIVSPAVPPPTRLNRRQTEPERGFFDHIGKAPTAITDRTRVNPERTIIQDKPWAGLLEVPGALKDIASNMMSGNPDVIADTAKGYAQGAYEGLGEFSSPLNLADVATGFGKSKLLQGANKVISLLTAGSGANNIAEGNVAQGLAEIAGGGIGMASRMGDVPVGTTRVNRNISPSGPTDEQIQEAVETMTGVNRVTPQPQVEPTLPPEIEQILKGAQAPPVVETPVIPKPVETIPTPEPIIETPQPKPIIEHEFTYDPSAPAPRPTVPDSVKRDFEKLTGIPYPTSPRVTGTGMKTVPPSQRRGGVPKVEGGWLPPPENVVPHPGSKTTQFLPRDLKGAKPKFNIGQDSYTPEFESDLDKALFIIAQDKPSRRNADFLKFVMDNTGMTQSQAMAAGRTVRRQIKDALTGVAPGGVKIPKLYDPPAMPMGVKPEPSVSSPPVVPKPQGIPGIDPDVDKLVEGLGSPEGSVTFASTVKGVDPPTAKMEGTSIIMTNPTPELVKAAIKAGYKFKGVRADNTFEMVPGGNRKPPILEGEVGIHRPTPKKSGMGGLDDKTPTAAMEAFNFSRAVMASVDMSAPLRQGLPLIHKPQFWKALSGMVRSWGSERAYNDIMQGILERPLFKARVGPNGKPLPSFAEEAGLKLTDLNSLTGREEHIMSTWAEKIPGVRMSNRAYTAFLNKLRADVFDDLVSKGQIFGADGKANLALSRGLADFVNTASGRGSLGSLEKSAATLNSMFFSPRLIASRLKMLNPVYYVMAPPMVRKEAIKSLIAITVAGNVVTQLGKMAAEQFGSDKVSISYDPSSSDFGKLRIGDTRLDPWGGFQQYIVAANRLINPMGPATGFRGDTPFTRGQMTTSSNVTPGRKGKEYNLWNENPGPYDPSWVSTAGRFARGKVHPTLGFAWSFLDNQTEMDGTKMDFTTANPMKNAVAQRFVPIFMQDLYELTQNDPKLAAILGPMAGLGMSVQSYGRDK